MHLKERQEQGAGRTLFLSPGQQIQRAFAEDRRGVQPFDDPSGQPLAEQSQNDDFPIDDERRKEKYSPIHPKQSGAGVKSFPLRNGKRDEAASAVRHPLPEQDGDADPE